ncbi:MAG: CopD family protein [Lacibacter sp.]|jgi:putative membrane protein
MSYLYIKAIHVIFIVTWFAGLFYMPRLFIYNVEANQKDEGSRKVLQEQFGIMMKRLWYGITWPSAVLTLIFGIWVLFESGIARIVFLPEGRWMLIKLIFVLLLYVYHLSLHKILKQQLSGRFNYSSQQLRIWNEVATIFLVAIVMLVIVKQNLSAVWGIAGLVLFVIVLTSAIKIYKLIRKK